MTTPGRPGEVKKRMRVPAELLKSIKSSAKFAAFKKKPYLADFKGLRTRKPGEIHRFPNHKIH